MPNHYDVDIHCEKCDRYCYSTTEITKADDHYICPKCSKKLNDKEIKKMTGYSRVGLKNV